MHLPTTFGVFFNVPIESILMGACLERDPFLGQRQGLYAALENSKALGTLSRVLQALDCYLYECLYMCCYLYDGRVLWGLQFCSILLRDARPWKERKKEGEDKSCQVY